MSSVRTCLLVQARRSVGNKLFFHTTYSTTSPIPWYFFFWTVQVFFVIPSHVSAEVDIPPAARSFKHVCYIYIYIYIYIYSMSSSVRNAQPCMRDGRHSSLSSVNTYIVSVCLYVCLYAYPLLGKANRYSISSVLHSYFSSFPLLFCNRLFPLTYYSPLFTIYMVATYNVKIYNSLLQTCTLLSRAHCCHVVVPPWTGYQYIQKNKSKRIPSIFKDESTGSCICLWKLAVAVATYVWNCIVYRILSSFAF
jgi:hypothetical protein